ncbi:MAG: HEPN domain-containing protein [Armatimonadetes bacterium]|nr:HEPN domain-containing protein [Armatimonadota bacterium]
MSIFLPKNTSQIKIFRGSESPFIRGNYTKSGEPTSQSSQHWAEQARYDLESARAMLNSGRYLSVLSCCQQAVEKMLKAIISERSQELPPRIHHLARLAEAAAVEMSDDQLDFLRELSAYYIQTRYPEEIPDLASLAKEDEARRVMNQTEEIVQWLNSIL